MTIAYIEISSEDLFNLIEEVTNKIVLDSRIREIDNQKQLLIDEYIRIESQKWYNKFIYDNSETVLTRKFISESYAPFRKTELHQKYFECYRSTMKIYDELKELCSIVLLFSYCKTVCEKLIIDYEVINKLERYLLI